MSDYQSLIERVEGLSGPCRETDAAIARALGAEAGLIGRIGWKMRRAPWNEWSNGRWECLPKWTRSIDAALSLVERKLPGRAAGVVLGAFADVLSAGGYRSDEPLQSQLARAIILALLRALQSQEEGR